MYPAVGSVRAREAARACRARGQAVPGSSRKFSPGPFSWTLSRRTFLPDSEDWLRNDERGISTLKRDLNVTVRLKPQEEPEAFTTEEWATRFPDPQAFVLVFELWYGASFVQDYYFCAVDGYRARLPYPEVGGLTISREKYAIAKAVDLSDSLDEYIPRAGLRIED